MNLAGSTQVSLGKKLLGEYEWWKFEPIANGAEWADGKAGDKYAMPYAFGDEGVRMVYVPSARAIVVKELEAGKRYGGIYFDPVTGEKTTIQPFSADAAGEGKIEPPKLDHDWVVVLEKSK
jgi:hypothetical protein